MPDQTDKLTSRDKQRIETRNRVFEAAIEEFHHAGVANAQIENIVKRANVSIGTYYRYFPTKDDVLFELLQRYMAQIADKIITAINDENLDIEQTLIATITPLFDMFETEDSPLIREIFGLIVKQPNQEFEWIESPMLQPILKKFQQELDKGNTEEDPVRLTRIFFTSMLGFITSMHPSRHRQEALHFIRIFLKGVRSPEN